MTMTEKVAYLKGLMAGLELDESKKETKVFNAILDVLTEMAASVTDCEDDIISLGEEVDDLTESVSDLEDEVYEDDDDCCEDDDDDEDDDDCCCGCEDCDDEDDDEETFEFTCPDCGEKLFLDEEVLEKGMLKCKACGREIEFEIVDDCGCEDCEDCCDCDDCAAEKDKE